MQLFSLRWPTPIRGILSEITEVWSFIIFPSDPAHDTYY